MTYSDNALDYIIVGQFGSTYGIKGWLKILSFTEKTGDILDYDPWYVEEKTEWKVLQIEEAKEYGKGLLVKLVGFDNPEVARLLSGKKIAILRSQLPKLKPDEYYWSDLTGLTVIDQHGQNLGKVIYLIATGSNDVLVVKGNKEHAIPYRLGEVIKKVDIEKGEIWVDWEVL